ncbi:MAG: hypothetical protein AAF135_21650 [Bacteroidota bacterium]
MGFTLGPENLSEAFSLILHQKPETKTELSQLLKILWLQKPELERLFDQTVNQHLQTLENQLTGNQTSKFDTRTDTPRNTAPSHSEREGGSQTHLKQPDQTDMEETKPSTAVEKDKSTSSSSFWNRRDIWLRFQDMEGGEGETIARAREDVPQFLEHNFVFKPRFWPVESRDFAQKWRYLRSENVRTPSKELNIEASLKSLTPRGKVLKPVFHTERKLQAQEVYILWDTSTHMIPFQSYYQYLLDSIETAIKPEKWAAYTFIEIPKKYLYPVDEAEEPLRLKKWLGKLTSRSIVFILSDAGAVAQPDKLDTLKFIQYIHWLQEIRRGTHKVMWLHPHPKQRWEGSTASLLPSYTTMVGSSEQELSHIPHLIKKW